MRMRWKKQPTSDVRFPLEKHQFTIRIHRGYCQHFCYLLFNLSNVLVPTLQMEYIANIIRYSFHYYGSLLLLIPICQLRIDIKHSMISHCVLHKISIELYK